MLSKRAIIEVEGISQMNVSFGHKMPRNKSFVSYESLGPDKNL